MKKILIISFWIINQSLYAQRPTKNELIQDFNTYIHYLEETHPDTYTAFGELMEFKKIYQNLRLSITDSTSIDELRKMLSTFTNKLEDGHTIIFDENTEILYVFDLIKKGYIKN